MLLKYDQMFWYRGRGGRRRECADLPGPGHRTDA